MLYLFVYLGEFLYCNRNNFAVVLCYGAVVRQQIEWFTCSNLRCSWRILLHFEYNDLVLILGIIRLFLFKQEAIRCKIGVSVISARRVFFLSDLEWFLIGFLRKIPFKNILRAIGNTCRFDIKGIQNGNFLFYNFSSNLNAVFCKLIILMG